MNSRIKEGKEKLSLNCKQNQIVKKLGLAIAKLRSSWVQAYSLFRVKDNFSRKLNDLEKNLMIKISK